MERDRSTILAGIKIDWQQITCQNCRLCCGDCSNLAFDPEQGFTLCQYGAEGTYNTQPLPEPPCEHDPQEAVAQGVNCPAVLSYLRRFYPGLQSVFEEPQLMPGLDD